MTRSVLEFLAVVLLAIIVGVLVGHFVGDEAKLGGLIGFAGGLGVATRRAVTRSGTKGLT
jgi:hypothetical protein